MFLQKIIMDKSKQFDNLMKYSMTRDSKYLKKIEEFYHVIGEVDRAFKYKLFNNLLEEFNLCISDKKENTVANILDLYARIYSKVEELNEKLKDENCGELKNSKHRRSFVRDEEILVIDDDILLLKLIGKSMKEQGYNVILCSDPFEAIDILKERKISLVILDMILPNIDGFQMTKIIRKSNPIPPIIIISERDDLKTKINALKVGADDYITKPIKKGEFYARIDRTLDRVLNYNVLSIEDGLTGAYTKDYFWERANEKRALYSRNNVVFSIAFIDMDNFKSINDIYGHLIGDQVLKCFIKALNMTLRNTDLVFRFGGDEFIIIFPETTEEKAKRVLERFKNKKNCNGCNDTECISLSKTYFSAGITEIKGKDDTVEELIKRADIALYEAKVNGGDAITIYKD